jgi:hypothetical protein
MIKKIASNASANVVSGLVSFLYQIGLVAVASRVWGGIDFSIWALALSIAAIAPLFGSNLSSVVTRRLLHANKHLSQSNVPAILFSARLLERQLSVLAIVLLTTIGAILFFYKVSSWTDLYVPICLLFSLIGTNIWIVLWQVKFGRFYAVENNWSPAFIMGGARLGGLLFFILGIQISSQSLLISSLFLFGGTWIGVLVSNRLTSKITKNYNDVALKSIIFIKVEYLENLRIYSGFVIWSLGALFIQYCIPPIFSMIEPDRFNAFYLAYTLSMVAIGVLSTGMSALLAPFLRWHGDEKINYLKRIIYYGPAIASFVSLTIFSAEWYLIGPSMELLSIKAAPIEQVKPFISILGFQSLIRLTAMGYSLVLASLGNPKEMSFAIFFEIILTIMVAFPFGWFFGPYLLLWGLVFSGFISSLYTCYIGFKLISKEEIKLSRAVGIFVLSQISVCTIWLIFVHKYLEFH